MALLVLKGNLKRMEHFYPSKSLVIGQITEIHQEILERSFKADTPNTAGY
jgi:hypothetical protein